MNNMKKMKFYLVSAFVFAFISGMAQSNGLIQRVERINDTLYLVQNEENSGWTQRLLL
jgi:hypothetical protein